jgi:lactoylglutathione lyase
MTSMQISGFGINVADLDRSADFYTRGLGLEEKGKYDLGHMHEVLVGSDGDSTSILLIKYTSRSEAPDIGTGYEKIVLLCDDVAGAYERALTEGGTSEMEPRTIEAMGITVAMVRDPDGYKVELVEQIQPS